MFHNSTVGRRTPYNLLAVLLFGVDRRSRSGHVMMPSFDGEREASGGLPDDELAALANFVVRQFGNPAAATITTRDIQTARSGSWVAGGTTAVRGQLVAVGGGARAAGGAGTACFRCHGLEGEGEATAGYPRLAGLDARYLVKQMRDYRSGARPGRVMSAIARQLDPADYQGIALYYAELPARLPPVRATVADSALVQRGATLYARGSAERRILACAACHGPDGRGLNRTYPSIVQPASYTDAQLRLWRAGVRRNDIGDVMARLARPMTDDDVRALSAYVAGLTP
jgi:cytochrome c553